MAKYIKYAHENPAMGECFYVCLCNVYVNGPVNGQKLGCVSKRRTICLNALSLSLWLFDCGIFTWFGSIGLNDIQISFGYSIFFTIKNIAVVYTESSPNTIKTTCRTPLLKCVISIKACITREHTGDILMIKRFKRHRFDRWYTSVSSFFPVELYLCVCVCVYQLEVINVRNELITTMMR